MYRKEVVGRDCCLGERRMEVLKGVGRNDEFRKGIKRRGVSARGYPDLDDGSCLFER